MKKLLPVLLALCAMTTQAQNFQQRIDSIRVAETTEDSTSYVVYFTTLGGYDKYMVEYKEKGTTIQANILYSLTEQPQQTTIKIKNDTYRNAIVTIMNRFQTGGTSENPEYSNWEEVDSEEILLKTKPKEYTPLLLPENQWNELVENFSLSPEHQYQKTYITKIGSDTLINGVSYYKLLTARDELSSVWSNNGYIREDIETRKVYYKPQKDEQEILLYNFNVLDMQVGNEIQSYDFQYKTNVLLKIERVEYDYIGGESRMIVTLRSTSLDVNCVCYEDHIWIEGIGNMDGFLRSTMAMNPNGSDKMSLLCFFQNDELIYRPEDAKSEDCFVWWEGNTPITTHTIVNENSSWATLTYLLGAENGKTAIVKAWTDYYFFDGDSVFNGKTYKKVFYHGDEQHTERFFAGLMREENLITYFKTTNTHTDIEANLYDFSVKTGDTFEHTVASGNYIGTIILQVLQSDSVLINNELKKRLIISERNKKYPLDTIIENVGSLQGLLYPLIYTGVGTAQELLCYTQNDELLYQNPKRAKCYYDNPKELMTSVQTKSTDNYSIFPNPVDDILYISYLNNTISQVTIFDMNGKEIYRQTHGKEINVSSLAAGNYVLNVHDVNGTVSLFTFIKK